MKIAILSDIHANLAALEAVLEDVADQGAETIYNLGDVLGYGPDPRACLARAQDFPVSLMCNHEEAVLIGAIGFNPKVLEPMMDILFDEKIAGSFHFTPGNAYDDADNTNRSEVHWDLVTIQRPEYGGGEIWFDGELIRKDGLFITEDLAGLNPPE